MRRNNTLSLIFFILLLPLYGDGISTDDHGENRLVVSHAFPMNHKSAVLESLKRGSSSELILQFRIHRKRHSFLTILNEKIYSKEIVYTARWDIFTECFKITDSEGHTSFYEDEMSFFDDFFPSETVIIPDYDFSDDLSSYYIRFKAILIKRVYVDPFHFFQFVDFGNRISTDWTDIELRREENAH